MTKYAAHNKNGEFDIKAASNAIGEDEQIVEMVLNLLNEIGAIKINSFSENVYNIEYLSTVSYKDLTNLDEFEELKENWENKSKFKEQILSADEKELAEMLG